MTKFYKVKDVACDYGVFYCDTDGTETMIEICNSRANAEKICNILNADMKNKVYEPVQSCQNCTNRYICPTYKKDSCCMGFNDEELFRTLFKMMLGGTGNMFVDKMLDKIKEIQRS